jgi:hypothetical protein
MGFYSEERFIVVSVKLIVLLIYTLGRDRNHHSGMKFFETGLRKGRKYLICARIAKEVNRKLLIQTGNRTAG